MRQISVDLVSQPHGPALPGSGRRHNVGDAPFHHFYAWSETRVPRRSQAQIAFPRPRRARAGRPTDEAGRRDLHRSHSHQPDLNVANPEVRDAIAQVAGFWLEQGLSRFRVEAVPVPIQPTGFAEGAAASIPTSCCPICAASSGAKRRGVLLGRGQSGTGGAAELFGDQDGDDAAARSSRSPSTKGRPLLSLARMRAARAGARGAAAHPPDCQWADSVRNDDELTLDKLSDDERQEVFVWFGRDEELQLYGRGRAAPASHARRRPAPHPDGLSLAFSLPGTAVLFDGEEIGMAENLAIEGRYSARAPMQWSDEPQSGFTTADRGGPSGRREPVRLARGLRARERRDPRRCSTGWSA